jgi:hypothetical protein
MGCPRTAIMGFGNSSVSSRMRVPLPAARRTTLWIVVELMKGADKQTIGQADKEQCTAPNVSDVSLHPLGC